MRRFALLAAAWAGMLLPACVADHGPCPPEPAELQTCTLYINILANELGTRAATEGEGSDAPAHETEEGLEAERYINIANSDYRIFLLDTSGKLLMQFEPESAELTTWGDTPVYQLVGSFMPTTDAVQVLVLANWTTDFCSGYPDLVSQSATLEGLYGNTPACDFHYPAPASGASWVPEIKKSGIPMFGLSEPVQIYPEGTIASGKVGPLNPELTLKPIPMLRALAKIEVVNATEDEKVELKACRLTWYNKNGRFIPDGKTNPDWNTPAMQVVKPSLPADAGKTTEALTFVDGFTREGHPSFAAYIPEMDLTALGQNEARPYVEVDLAVNGRDLPTARIELASYKEGKADKNLSYLLRNHNYLFNITNVGIDMTLTITTDPWDLDGDQLWDYEDAEPTFSEAFQWKTNDESDWEAFDNTDMNDMYRILLVGSSPENAAYGSFTLKAPGANNPGLWTISVVSDDETSNDHFMIEVKTNGEWPVNSEKVDTYTAPITGDKVEFRIMASGANDSATDYTARVLMVVKTFDGRLVNICLRNKSDDSKVYHIDNVPNPDTNQYYFTVKQRTTGGDIM